MSDLPAEVFKALRVEFFENDLTPKPFWLRDKRSTQDDPLDEHLTKRLQALVPSPTRVIGSTGPLISPDCVIAVPGAIDVMIAQGGLLDTECICGVEVKKFDHAEGQKVARGSGMDYNSTPPSMTITVYRDGKPLLIPGFYLFVLLGRLGDDRLLETLVLCDGGALNEDTALYLATTGQRQKLVGLGTYGDGIDRQRPMFVFANPLGWTHLRGTATLIHRRDDLDGDGLRLVGTVRRTVMGSEAQRTYYAYRLALDARNEPLFDAVDPFPTPRTRSTTTQSRGKFVLGI